jgi:hypothetical protein
MGATRLLLSQRFYSRADEANTLLHLWRPAGNADSLSQTSKLKKFRKARSLTSKLTMAENSQPTKEHKPTNSFNDTQLEESEPIEVQISAQLAIPIRGRS